MITTIPKLLSLLHRNRAFFEALFEKRHRVVLLHEALEYLEEEQLLFLIESELIVRNDEHIELDDRILTFFEEMLETASDVEIGDVDEMIENMQHHILLYRAESDAHKERYLLKIERTLKKIPQMILKNLNTLQLHIGLTYKTQKSHHNKIIELKHYRAKLEKLILIEHKVEQILEIEKAFFSHLARHETVMLALRLKSRLRELRVSLTALQQEVIEYINKSLNNLAFYEHMIKLKELKTALELKERTNILPLIEAATLPLSFEKQHFYTGHIETDYIYEEPFEELVDKLRDAMQLPVLAPAQALEIDADFFDASHALLSMVDLDALHAKFCEQGRDLFSFVHDYAFVQEKSFAARIEIYCQMALMFEEQYAFSDSYAQTQGFSYLNIYPKGGDL